MQTSIVLLIHFLKSTLKPKYFKVGVGEQYFWTTGELLAMAQDCERTFNDPPMEMNLNLYGEDTLVTALWNI